MILLRLKLIVGFISRRLINNDTISNFYFNLFFLDVLFFMNSTILLRTVYQKHFF